MSRKPKREIGAVQLVFDSVPNDSIKTETTDEINEITRRKGARVARGSKRATSRRSNRKAG